MRLKELAKRSVKAIAENSAKRNANNTTSGVLYQPKAPKSLKNFSKVNNGK